MRIVMTETHVRSLGSACGCIKMNKHERHILFYQKAHYLLYCGQGAEWPAAAQFR